MRTTTQGLGVPQTLSIFYFTEVAMPILFKSDWKKYPGSQPNFETKNKSFLDLAAKYKQMGVKNHTFLLALHDQGLKDVDPFDPNLTLEWQIRVAEECKENFWYYIREIACDPAGGRDNRIMLEANRGIIAAYWLYFAHITFMLIMIRQTGKSFGISWLYQWLENIGTTHYDISHLVPNERLAGREIERQKAMEAAVPAYLRMRSAKDPGNTEVMRISALNNNFKIYVSNKSPVIADQIGRGMTTGTVGNDEFAYIFNNFITIPVILSAGAAARELAAKKGEPYGVFFGTTSGKRDTPHGRYAFKMMMDSAPFTELFFDCVDEEDLRKTVAAGCRDADRPKVNVTFNHRQLGKSDEWLKRRIAESENEDPVQIAADYFNEWPSGSSETPFTPDELKTMRASEKEVLFSEIAKPENYAVNWYYPENEIKARLDAEPHVLGTDPSEAGGDDSFSFILVNAYTGEVAMDCSVAKANIWLLAEFCANLLVKYRKIVIIPERRSAGVALCDYLCPFLSKHGIDPFTRIYNQVVQFSDEYPKRFEDIQQSGGLRERIQLEYKKFFGYPTSSGGQHSRSGLYSEALRQAVRMGAFCMNSRNLILQTVSLEKKDGRIDHPRGEHDDSVIAWLLCYWLLSYGRNLHYYGIDASLVLTRNKNYHSQLTEKTAYENYRQKRARSLVEELTQKLEVEKDDFIARRYEQELEAALADLSEDDRKIVSADDLLKRLRQQRTEQAGSGYLDYIRQYENYR